MAAKENVPTLSLGQINIVQSETILLDLPIYVQNTLLVSLRVCQVAYSLARLYNVTMWAFSCNSDEQL